MRKNPYMDEDYTLISTMMNNFGLGSDAMCTESISKSAIDIELSNASTMEDNTPPNEFKFMSQDFNVKRQLENEQSIYGINTHYLISFINIYFFPRYR